MSAHITVWFDKTRMKGGAPFQDSLATAIQNSDLFLLILTNDSIQSEFVKKEISWAEIHKKTIIPLKLGACNLPFEINRLHFVDFSLDKAAGQRNLIGTLDLSPKQIKRLTKSKAFKPKKRRRRKIIILLIITAILAFLVVKYEFVYSQIKTESIDLTITIEPTNNETEAPIPNQIKYSIINKFLWLEEPRDSIIFVNNKEAIIKLDALPVFSKSRLKEIKFIYLDSSHTSMNGSFIVPYNISLDHRDGSLPLTLDIMTINGTVKNSKDDSPVPNVRITYLGFPTQSDSLGNFNLFLPESMVLESVKIKANHEKYWNFDAHPQILESDSLYIPLEPKRTVIPDDNPITEKG
jgi:hypothetical protein